MFTYYPVFPSCVGPASRQPCGRDTDASCAVERLLEGLKPYIADRLADPDGKGAVRVIISTPLPESAVAEYLTELAARVEPRGVKVGSYPRWGKQNNTVTLVGK